MGTTLATVVVVVVAGAIAQPVGLAAPGDQVNLHPAQLAAMDLAYLRRLRHNMIMQHMVKQRRHGP